MKKTAIIEIAKFVGALTIGVAIGAITRPAVNKFFGLDKKAEPDMIPSEDIEEEEICEE